MDTRIEWTAPRRWDVVSDDEREAVIGFIHEGSDEPDDFTILTGEVDPSLLADLTKRRYASLDQVAGAIGEHLEGACRIT